MFRILGQLVAEYLKDAVYPTCGRQLLTLCCTKTNTHKGKHTDRRTHTHLHTCAHYTHTLYDANNNGETLILAHTQKYPHIRAHTVHFMLISDREEV